MECKIKSKYKGVSWVTRTQRWKAEFKKEYLGAFRTEKEAALAVDLKRIKAGLEPMILKPKTPTS